MSGAVYPSEVLATVVWRDVVSARASRRILVRRDGEVVATAGLIWRDAQLDGAPVLIGGLGGVMTAPPLQRRGYGAVAVRAAMQTFMRERRPRFGLLFCEEKNVGFYDRLGWRRFDGEVTVEQTAGRVAYRIMQAMVAPLCAAAPEVGDLDLDGPPW